VAELADAADSKASVTPLLKPTHRCTSKNKGYLARRTKKDWAFSQLLILAHRKVIDKLKN